VADEPTGTPAGQEPTNAPATEPTPTTTTPSQQPAAAPAPQQQQVQPNEPAPSNDQGSDDGEPFDKDRALNTIRKLRGFEKTANELQKRLAEYERKEEEARLAQLSEQDRLKELVRQREAELDHERTLARDRMNHYEVQLQASKLGIVDPDAAVKLLDWGSLDYDDEGRPADIVGALKDLLASKPYLAAQPAPTQPAQPAPHTQLSPTNAPSRANAAQPRRYTRAEISNRAFYVANRDDIKLAMREGRID
jgi:hypothetical protein